MGTFRTILVCLLVAGARGAAPSGAQHQDSAPAAHFILVGDTGTGDERARRVAGQIQRTVGHAPVSHVFLLGDNVYEHGEARFIGTRFLDVYRDVVSAGVRIHAALGNHDVERCRESGVRPVPRNEDAYALSPECEVDAHLATPEFGYRDGFRYYSVQIPGTASDGSGRVSGERGAPPSPATPLVEVFVLDSNTLGETQTKLRNGSDDAQLGWVSRALGSSRARWKVVAIHHPMYTPRRCKWWRFGCRGEDDALGPELEPIFRAHGVDIVFQGHQHLYARLKPQHGIRYFVTGAGGKKADSARNDERTVPREDRGAFTHFVYVRAAGDRLSYCVMDAEGKVRDSGSFARGDVADREVEDDLCAVP